MSLEGVVQPVREPGAEADAPWRIQRLLHEERANSPASRQASERSCMLVGRGDNAFKSLTIHHMVCDLSTRQTSNSMSM
jgi:hypothetical protein